MQMAYASNISYAPSLSLSASLYMPLSRSGVRFPSLVCTSLLLLCRDLQRYCCLLTGTLRPNSSRINRRLSHRPPLDTPTTNPRRSPQPSRLRGDIRGGSSGPRFSAGLDPRLGPHGCSSPSYRPGSRKFQNRYSRSDSIPDFSLVLDFSQSFSSQLDLRIDFRCLSLLVALACCCLR